MKTIFKRTVAVLLLAIYVINPLHAVLHLGHDHDHSHHGSCSSESDNKLQVKQHKVNLEDKHECYFCQNQQDRVQLISDDSSPNEKTFLTQQTLSTAFKTAILDSNIFFIESRGPPLFC